MTTTIKLILLFVITNSYSQTNEFITNIVGGTNENSTNNSSKNQEEKTVKYSYLGLTMHAPDPNKIYAVDEIEKRPEFPGAEAALKAYIKENFKTPVADNGKKITGTIFACFVIEKDGSVSEIGILHDYGYGSGDEAIRVLEKMPKWIAGVNDASAVRCMYAMPIVCDGD
jgi:hypothetical protein